MTVAGSAFDLDQFAPAGTTIKVRGVEFRLDADPDVDAVARMLRIEDTIGEASKAADTGGIEGVVAAVQEGKQLIADLILAADDSQDVSKLKLNTQDVMTLFALVMHGSSVAAAIARAISQPTPGGGDGDAAVSTAHDGSGDGGEDGEASPLVSASTSHERSSASDVIDDGLLVTGTA